MRGRLLMLFAAAAAAAAVVVIATLAKIDAQAEQALLLTLMQRIEEDNLSHCKLPPTGSFCGRASATTVVPSVYAATLVGHIVLFSTWVATTPVATW